MPRITKRLPETRADYTFGDLVYWHLFRFGTRPTGDPSAKVGRVWEPEAICTLLDITDRTLRNWLFDRHLPDSIVDLSRELFGDNKQWDEARLELQERLENMRASKARRAEARPVPQAREPDAVDPPTDADSPLAIEEPVDEVTPSPASRAEREASLSQALGALPPVALGNPEPQQRPSPRHALRALVAGLTIFAGILAWMHMPRQPYRPAPQPEKPTAMVTPPKEVPAPPKAVPQEPPTVPAERPAPEPTPPPRAEQPPQPPPTEEELRAAEQRRLAEALIAARQAAYEREQQRLEDEAIRRDAETRAADDARRERESDARTAAGLGYRLRENMAVAGASFTQLRALNLKQCALACERNTCDAFAYYRDHYPAGSGKPRVCYLYRKPYVVSANAGYALGERTHEPRLSPRTGQSGSEAPIRLAQGAPPPDTSGPAGVTRCSGGPVKVTGFTLACDRIMGGGTTLGSTRLSHTVADINECAAKCRPVAKCTAFTFNSADAPGQHACTIFGGAPEGRASKGWVSGVR
jgi:hypothetical protein